MRLLVLRHAKSSWDHSGLSDHERPLNSRGRNDAPKIGRALYQKGILPQLVLCSSAQRTRETFDLIRPSTPGAEILYDERLYLAGPDEILDVLRENAYAHTVLVIAHNPGVTYLVNQLTNSRIDNIPTAGLACIELSDGQLERQEPEGQLLYFVYPKGL